MRLRLRGGRRGPIAGIRVLLFDKALGFICLLHLVYEIIMKNMPGVINCSILTSLID